MPNPAVVIAEAMPAILNVAKAARKGGVKETTLELVHQRVSQINGCSACVHGGAHSARNAGVSDDQLFGVAAWRESPFFDDAERAALALAEAATRLADRADPVPDEVWEEAAAHYDERQLASLVLIVGVTNLFNRLNASTRQIAGATW
jgi:AhpD family alkylhydroperoxidase